MSRRAERRPTLLTPAFLAVLVSTLAYFIAVGATLPLLSLFVKGPLGGDSVAVGFASGSFAVSAIVLRPFMGRLGDRRGRRLLIVGGAALGGLSLAGYALAESLWVLVPMRLIGGIGEAAFFTGAATATADMAPEERRGEAVSFFSLGLYAGIAIGPLLGEWILDGTHFTRVWLIAGGGLMVSALLGIRVPDTRPEGVAGEEQGGLINRAGLVPGFVIAASVWGFAGFESFVPLYARDLALDGSRFVFLTYALVILAVRLFGARIPDRVGPRRTATVSLATSAVGLVLMTVLGTPVGLYTGTVVFALGQSLAFPALMSLAVAAAPAAQRGSVIGTFTAFVDLGFGIGPVTAGAVVAMTSNRGAFAAGAVAAVIGLAILRTRPEVRPVRPTAPPAAVPEVEG